MTLWLDGERFDTTRAPFDLSDRGLLLGDGVFDTSLVLGGRVVFREAHLARLSDACRTLGFALDADRASAAMDAAALDAGTGSVRLTVTRGPGPRGIAPPPSPRPTIFASNAAGPPGSAFAPLRLHPTAIRRNETSPASQMKVLNYLDAVLALDEARRHGFDEALFLNGAGRVASAGSGNLFALKDGEIATPPTADGVLPGIVRQTVLRLAPRLGLRPVERSMTPEELGEADALVMTNSLRLLAPVRRIGDRVLARRGETAIHALAVALCAEITHDTGADTPGVIDPARVLAD